MQLDEEYVVFARKVIELADGFTSLLRYFV